MVCLSIFIFLLIKSLYIIPTGCWTIYIEILIFLNLMYTFRLRHKYFKQIRDWISLWLKGSPFIHFRVFCSSQSHSSHHCSQSYTAFLKTISSHKMDTMSYFTVQGTREILYHKRIMMPKWIIVHQTSLLLKWVTTVYHRDSLIYELVNNEGHFLECVKLNGHPGVLSKAESCSPVVVCYFYC